MGHLNLPASKRNARQWKLLDIVSATFFGLVLLFFLLVFTPLGDSLAASGRQALLMSTSDPRQRQRLVALIEAGHHVKPIESCPADSVDHMPCEDPRRNSQLSREMNFYRERHCPLPDQTPLCLIPPPRGYKIPVPWPESLSKVASFGGSMLSENILTLSFAPRDSHKAQIQFALERGIPAFVAMLGTRRLPFPAFSFDIVHCSRCLIPFTAYNATYLIEVDRLLRPGGYLVISGPPVQWPKQDKEWADLQAVARALCYELIAVDGNTVIWKKPVGESCLSNQNEFGLELCDESDDPNYAWYFKLKKCVSGTSSVKGEYAVGTIPKWPQRLTKAPSRALVMKNGYDVFEADSRRWRRRVAYYKNTLNVKLGTPAIRNIMDMNAFFGGFAAALTSDPVWVMNVVPARKSSTLSVIYDRGLIGVYHDWCEPFSTYPRTYDLIHVSGIESLIKNPGSNKNSCSLVDLMVEMDRMLRPEGTVVVRDSPEVIDKVSRIANTVRWTAAVHDKEPGSNGREKILVATKSLWKLPS
ncbi:hypothetical protein CISIN_1g007645mg [Citrus sinensis]|uniref:Methyltransferase n=2 Tax=Citrus sinensis TaxID=2711 RepID=A0A067H2C4_CITSI|nr:hypothetical protein CISIN_1g007645mg [Citrus sinensis]